jgi:two-component system NarL family sensor kinase
MLSFILSMRTIFRKFIFLGVFILFYQQECYAQMETPYTLIDQLQKTEGKQRFVLFNRIVDAFEADYNYPAVEKYSNEALKEALVLNSPIIISQVLLKLGKIYKAQGKMQEAIGCFDHLLDLGVKMKDSLIIAKAYTSLAGSYILIGKGDTAFVYLEKALPIFIDKNDKENISTIYSNLASIYGQRADYHNAINYEIESIKISSEIGDAYGAMFDLYSLSFPLFNLKDYDNAIISLNKALSIAEWLNNENYVASCLSQLGAIYIIQKKLVLAQSYLFRALEISERTGNLNARVGCYVGLGRYAVQKNELDSALLFYEKAKLLANEYGITTMEALLYHDIGNVYMKKKYYDKALKSYSYCVERAIEDKNYDILSGCYLQMSFLYEKKGRINEAFKYFKLHSVLNDSILDVEKIYKINNTIKGYEVEKKEAEIKRLEQDKLAAATLYEKQKFQVFAWVIATICSIVTGILFYICQRWRNRVRSVRKEITEKEFQAKQVVNSVEAERKKISKDLHDSIGVLISASRHSVENLLFKDNAVEIKDGLHQVSKLLEKSVQEVRQISHQMSSTILSYFGLVPAINDLLESTLSATQLEYEFEYGDFNQRLETETELCLYRVAQESLANIIKHAEANKVKVELWRDDDSVYFSITDDGKGFAPGTKLNGMGIGNMRTRVEVLKGNFKINGGNQSTCIQISLPLVTHEHIELWEK